MEEIISELKRQNNKNYSTWTTERIQTGKEKEQNLGDLWDYNRNLTLMPFKSQEERRKIAELIKY